MVRVLGYSFAVLWAAHGLLVLGSLVGYDFSKPPMLFSQYPFAGLLLHSHNANSSRWQKLMARCHIVLLLLIQRHILYCDGVILQQSVNVIKSISHLHALASQWVLLSCCCDMLAIRWYVHIVASPYHLVSSQISAHVAILCISTKVVRMQIVDVHIYIYIYTHNVVCVCVCACV